jgi:hypothetical protein
MKFKPLDDDQYADLESRGWYIFGIAIAAAGAIAWIFA